VHIDTASSSHASTLWSCLPAKGALHELLRRPCGEFTPGDAPARSSHARAAAPDVAIDRLP
jgi:hypothetical protein